MNNGAYISQDPAILGPKIEEIVRADLGLGSPVPFEIIPGDAQKLGARTFLVQTPQPICSAGKKPC